MSYPPDETGTHPADEGAWAANQRYVFAELRRHGRTLEKIDQAVDNINLSLAKMEADRDKIVELERRLKELEEKILENSLPKWMIAIAIAVLASALIPAIRAFLVVKGADPG